MNPSILLIFGIGGFLFFAIIFVVGFRMLRDEQAAKEKDKNKPPDSKPATTPSPQPVPVPMPPPPPMSTQYDNAHEVLRVLRDNLTGRLIVEIAGRRYERVGDIRDPDVGRGFVTTLRDLQKFMAGTQSPASSLPSLPPVEAPRPPESPLTARLAQGSSPSSPTTSSSTPARQTLSDLPPIQKPSMNPFKQAKILKDMEKNQELAPKSIPEQIDEILQEKLARTPHRGRGCRVYLGLKGGVVFELDGKSYEGVGEVPDSEVQAIIRAAVADWEKKQ